MTSVEIFGSFLRIVSIAEPAAVLMENVPDMALDQDMMILRSMHAELEALGYAVKSQVVESWRYGVPQHRQRLIMVALRDQKEFVWPAEVEQLTTLSNAISDLPPVQGGWLEAGGADGFFSYEGPHSSYQRRMREGVAAEASNKNLRSHHSEVGKTMPKFSSRWTPARSTPRSIRV